ncbi:MAG: NmrA/HSCARG family protein [Acidiferrobacterales bacterium]
MNERQTILVTGATGAQGGSVARHLMSGNKFSVRCLTRSTDSDKARALKDAGAELVKGDLDDIESLSNAIEGCYGVFGLTNYWEHFGKEYQQGKNLVDAVARADIEQFVFSTLPYAKKISQGQLEVPHFDIKAELEEYCRGLEIPATFIHMAFYFENFINFFPLRQQDDGSFTFGFPQGDTPLAGVAVDDIGGIVAAIFDRPAEFRDKAIGVVGDDLSPHAYAEIMTRVLGKNVVYHHIPREVFAGFDFPGAGDLANMFEFNRLYIPNRQPDLAECRKLYPAMQSFEAWLRANKAKF